MNIPEAAVDVAMDMLLDTEPAFQATHEIAREVLTAALPLLEAEWRATVEQRIRRIECTHTAGGYPSGFADARTLAARIVRGGL